MAKKEKRKVKVRSLVVRDMILRGGAGRHKNDRSAKDVKNDPIEEQEEDGEDIIEEDKE